MRISNSCAGVKPKFAVGASAGLAPIEIETGFDFGFKEFCAISKLFSNAIKEFLTPTPLRSTADVNCSFVNGSAPLPASAPKSAAEITVPLLSATSEKSPEINFLAAASQALNNSSELTRPSPIAVFSVIE